MTLRCLHEISFWAKRNVFNAFSGQSVITIYMIQTKIKLTVDVAVILTEMNFYFG